MSKQYEFHITAKTSPTNTGTARYTVEATSILEAKNKFKSSFHNAKIISCVRGCETRITPSPRANSSEAGSAWGLLGSLALMAGTAIATTVINKKDRS